MKLAVMQPYFFPYIGYFSLMVYADEFILFDTVQYDRKGWMNRNRVLKPGKGWQYIRAGVVKPPFRATIKDVEIVSDHEWKKTLLRQLEHYKNMAPYFKECTSLIETSLTKPASTLTEVNKNTLESVRDYLGIVCPIKIFSEMKLEIGEVVHAGQWALRISEAMGAKEYVNPFGGKEIFNSNDFQQAGVKLSFLESNLPEYVQRCGSFENGLSIIDLLMFCGINDIQDMLQDYSIKEN